jgi:hypothetical protein
MDTFCVLPWYSLELPANTPCCLLPKGTNIDQLKINLLNGIAAPACTKCWTIESQNQKSRRQLENEFLDYKLEQDLSKIKQDCIEQKNQTLLYQIQTSNLCNQACVTCNSYASSKWAEIETKMGLVPAKSRSIGISSIDIDYKSAQRISLLGGEPFFDPTTFEILKKLIDHENVDCFVSLVTNGNIKLKPKQSDLLAKFKNLNICVSIDGIGSVFEYMRWPAKWPTLLENLEEFKKITKNISISYTISSLNVFYYEQTINWFKEQNLRYNHNIVSTPNWLSLDSMPIELKSILVNNQFATLWPKTIGDEISLNEYKNKIYLQDQAKRINIRDYLPEIWEILNDSANAGK